MATQLPVKKNNSGGAIFYIALSPQTPTGAFVTNPSLSSGDVKISLDGGAFANLGTLPAVTPAAGVAVKVTLSQAETNADNIAILFHSASAVWNDAFFNLQTSARTFEDLAFPATSGRSMVVDAAGLVDANMVKAGPTGSGTAITARDIGASVLLSSGTGTGQVKLSAGYVAPNWGDIGNPTTVINLSGTNIQGVNSLASGSDAVSTVATAGSTLTTGSAVSGTYASTAQLDGVYWQIADTTGTLDMYFEFNVGSVGVPTSAFWSGGLTSALNSLKVFAYNWGATTWEQIGTLTGMSSLVVNTQEYDFTTAHVGTGGNIGLVRLRFQNTGLTTANFYTDRVICSYTSIYSFPSNFGLLSVDASGRVDLGKWIGVAPLALSSQLVQTDAYVRLGAPAGASVSADIAAIKSDTGAVKTQTDKMAFTVTNQIDANVLDWKSATAPAMTGDAYARLGAPAGASVSADVAAVKSDTGSIKTAVGTAGAGLTALGDTRIGNLDAAVSTRATPTNITAGTITTVTNLTNAPTSGDFTATMKTSITSAVPTAATIGQAVWDALTSALTTVGSIGKLLVTNIDAAISSRSTYAGGDTSGTTTLLGRLTSTRAGYLDNLSAGAVAQASVLGTPAGASVSADIAAVKTDTAAIKAKTDNLPASPASTSDVTTVGSAVAALNNVSTSQVKAQVVAALSTDTYAEPGQGAPVATNTLASKLGYLFKAWRNKSTQDASNYALYADDTTTVDQKATVSDDDVTFTRSEVGTGP